MGKRIARRTAISSLERLEPRRLLSDVIAVGPEFRVSTHTPSSQYFPSIGLDADGDFVVTWSSYLQDGSGEGVYAQRFSAAGLPLGIEFRVNNFTSGGQTGSSLGVSPEGDFVIVWSGQGDGDSNGIFAQLFDSVGNSKGTEFLVNSHTTGTQWEPSVAMDADGDFVVAWSGLGAGDTSGIFARRYDADGIAQGTEFRVNTHTTSNQWSPSLASDAAGSFVITWSSDLQDGSFVGVYAQRYDAAGLAQGSEFRVNTVTSNTQLSAEAAMNSTGDFIVTWSGLQSGRFNIYAQRFDASGVPQGPEFRVNDQTTGDPRSSTIAIDSAGDFVITWHADADGSGTGSYARRFRADGVPFGGDFRANIYTTGQQAFPVVAADPDGDFVISWGSSGGQDGSGYGVYAQRYAVVPEVSASSFHFATAPHKLNFTFDRDVSASLGTDDLVVQNLTTMQTIPSNDFSLSYDTLTNVATFTYTGTTSGIIGMLPDGNYTATLIASGITTIQGAPMANDYVLNFQFLQGDADHDGRVNLQDFNILAGNFGQSPRDFTQGDFNYDMIVNLDDFNILAARFGQVLAAGPARSSNFEQDATDEDRDERIRQLLSQEPGGSRKW